MIMLSITIGDSIRSPLVCSDVYGYGFPPDVVVAATKAVEGIQ